MSLQCAKCSCTEADVKPAGVCLDCGSKMEKVRVVAPVKTPVKIYAPSPSKPVAIVDNTKEVSTKKT